MSNFCSSETTNEIKINEKLMKTVLYQLFFTKPCPTQAACTGCLKGHLLPSQLLIGREFLNALWHMLLG